MRQGLQLRYSQQLALTPQLQQSIRLLQLSSQELNQEIETLLEENPLLERGEKSEDSHFSESLPSTSSSEQASDESSQSEFNDPLLDDFYNQQQRWEESNFLDEDNDFQFQEADVPTLREHLIEQIRLMPLSLHDQRLASYLIDAINEDGYLEQSLEELLALLPEEFEIELLELQTALKHVQHLDPAGVAARNLAECLSLQLDILHAQHPFFAQAKLLVEKHLALLAGRETAKLCKLLNVTEAQLKQIHQLIKQLNPRPGSEFTQLAAGHYIQHEVVVKKVKGEWQASLNDEAVPKLRINQIYADILKRNANNNQQYLTKQMQEAKWMIKNIQQRFSTILRVTQAIVNQQKMFFEHGEIAMRPLVLREIADELGLHESTVSRVTSKKYMLTPRGIYELKYFFGSHVSTQNGGACSATAIRALIKQLIAEENPRKPLSDHQLSEILGKQGIMVARRTIAKYREGLNIQTASQRKVL
jgi:RNA polymerase sigma-54 factor